jgi:kinesin family protein 6/9
MVIIALQERARGKKSFVPYRNSLMTSVLRDSLGGNCKTSMIATINPDNEHLPECIGTCRFAGRVAMVSNSVQVNEEVDPVMVVRRLKAEIVELKEEIALLKGGDAGGEELDDAVKDKIRCILNPIAEQSRR